MVLLSKKSISLFGILLILVCPLVVMNFQKIGFDHCQLLAGGHATVASQASFLRSETDKLVLDLNDVVALHENDDALFKLKNFTTKEYEQYITAKPGKEHYALWRYMATFMKNEGGGRQQPYIDVGTRFVASSLALASAGKPILTFDLPKSKERFQAFRGKSEEEWQTNVVTAGLNISFCNEDLAQVSSERFQIITQSPLIILDTHHLPYSVPFERQFIWRLMAMKYDGIVLLDDIHLNPEMKRWWKELNETSGKQYELYDLTSVGHSSGTGLLDFSHRLHVSYLKKHV